jgi:hypothetical protein
MEINDTEVSYGESRWIEDYSELINGWGRNIYYSVREPTYF